MKRTIVCLLGSLVFAATAAAQSVEVFQTTPDLADALKPQPALHFGKDASAENAAVIHVDASQRFQEIDGFGASLTDAAAWLIAKKLPAAQADATMKQLFGRKDGIALSFLRQPVGSSDLAVTFYSFDDLCAQSSKACTTEAGKSDAQLEHFSLAHDQEYILPLLKKAVAINPALHVMLSPWSAPGWMKTTGSMLGTAPGTKDPAKLKAEFYPAFAAYLVKTVQGYQAAGIPVYALTVQNEPLYAPPTYSGMLMEGKEQAAFIGENLGPALAAAHLTAKIMAYDHNWDRPDFPETVLKDARAEAFVAGTAWHHYEGKPEVMTANHQEFPGKDQWVTESSGGTWQKGVHGNVLAEEAAELIAVMRNWSRSYILWALATDEHHGPFVGGCDTCRGLVTVDLSNPAHPQVRPELDYYVLGHASKFLDPGAVRIGSDEPAGSEVRDVAFRNPDGGIVLYVLNEGTSSQRVRIACAGKNAETTLPAGAVVSFLWKP